MLVMVNLTKSGDAFEGEKDFMALNNHKILKYLKKKANLACQRPSLIETHRYTPCILNTSKEPL